MTSDATFVEIAVQLRIPLVLESELLILKKLRNEKGKMSHRWRDTIPVGPHASTFPRESRSSVKQIFQFFFGFVSSVVSHTFRLHPIGHVNPFVWTRFYPKVVQSTFKQKIQNSQAVSSTSLEPQINCAQREFRALSEQQCVQKTKTKRRVLVL